MQLSSRDMKPSWKHSVFKIFCYSSKFMTSENLIRLFPLFRSRWTSPVIKMHVGWLIRAGWPNFWASYQNIQRVENYQLSHLSEGCGKGRTRSKNFAQIPEIQAERAAGVWGYQWRCPELFCLPIFLSQLEKQITHQPCTYTLAGTLAALTLFAGTCSLNWDASSSPNVNSH